MYHKIQMKVCRRGEGAVILHERWEASQQQIGSEEWQDLSQCVCVVRVMWVSFVGAIAGSVIEHAGSAMESIGRVYYYATP